MFLSLARYDPQWTPAVVSARTPTPAEQVAGAQVVNRSSVAALAFLVWDIFITFNDETKSIWPMRWTFSKFLFFYIRYVTVLVQISILFIGTELTPMFHFTSHDCFIWQVYQGIAALTIGMAVDFVLVLRVHALYHGSLVVSRTVFILYFIEIAAVSASLGIALPKIECNEICLVINVPPTLIIYSAVSVVFQCILFAFTAAKFLMALRDGWGAVPIIFLIMRDGTWAFFMLFIIMILQASLYLMPKQEYAGVLFGWLLTGYSFAGYRILLNLHRRNDTTTMPTHHDYDQFTTHIRFEDREISHGTDDTLIEMSPITTVTRS